MARPSAAAKPKPDDGGDGRRQQRKEERRPNPQYWRYLSLLAGIGTLVYSRLHAVETGATWGASLKRAFWAAYLFTYLDTSHKDGSRAWPWFQRLPYWRMVVGYMRGRVITEVPLDPEKQYIFGAHPHGINTWNHFLSMTDGCRFLSEQYPKARRDLAATVLFFIPFCKEALLWLGCVDAGAKTAHRVLQEGYSSLIYVGGEKEQILTQRGKDTVVVKPRKGFLRLAMQYGCDVVPYYAFGENDLYFTLNVGKDFQLWLASTYKIALPPCWGFILPFVPLPARVTVVCGAPIKVPKVENPTPEQVDALQAQYIAALTAVFDKYKVKYGGRSPDAVLDVQ